ncbi:hypothetical protein ACIQNG_37770 [Streptomyces sp. NPDC091377]|uniref:hypothetical protein n=1 Tax=Streptomyces sp. NPDC091377 TaxID=3365995 RepID=UPI00382EC476
MVDLRLGRERAAAELEELGGRRSAAGDPGDVVGGDPRGQRRQLLRRIAAPVLPVGGPLLADPQLVVDVVADEGDQENILFKLAEASLGAPEGTVRQVVFPAVSGGEATLRELMHEFKTRGPVYRRTVQTTLKASYTNH